MFETGKKRNAAKKAYEIAYALFRVSANLEEASVKERLGSAAIDLLISANAEEYGNAARSLAVIDAMVKFAIDLNMMSIANGDVLLREIAGMNEILLECMDKSDEVDVSKFFTAAAPIGGEAANRPRVPLESEEETVVFGEDDFASNEDVAIPTKDSFFQEQNNAAATDENIQRSSHSVSSYGQQEEPGRFGSEAILQKGFTKIASRNEGSERSGNPTNNLKSGNRQITILDRIRQSGNCKLKELQEVLPDCSERTLRYDIEDLIERNLVERVGAGGPSVFYRIRQI
jgi:hypothetical protein